MLKLEKLLKVLKSKENKKINYVVPDVFTLFDSKIEKKYLPNNDSN